MQFLNVGALLNFMSLTWESNCSCAQSYLPSKQVSVASLTAVPGQEGIPYLQFSHQMQIITASAFWGKLQLLNLVQTAKGMKWRGKQCLFTQYCEMWNWIQNIKSGFKHKFHPPSFEKFCTPNPQTPQKCGNKRAHPVMEVLINLLSSNYLFRREGRTN